MSSLYKNVEISYIGSQFELYASETHGNKAIFSRELGKKRNSTGNHNTRTFTPLNDPQSFHVLLSELRSFITSNKDPNDLPNNKDKSEEFVIHTCAKMQVQISPEWSILFLVCHR